MNDLVTQNHNILTTPATKNFVSFYIDDQIFGLDVAQVLDVVHLPPIVPMPLAQPEVQGLANLRSRVVTMIDVRTCLGLSPHPNPESAMAIVTEKNDAYYGLIIDRIGDVLTLKNADFAPAPSTLPALWQRCAAGIYKLNQSLLVVFHLDHMILELHGSD